MDNKRMTLAVLPVSKAHLLKELLKKEKIECYFEEVHMEQEPSLQSLRILIWEDHLETAFSVLDEFLGKPNPAQNEGVSSVRQILVPVDFSPYSMKAAIVAFEIARRMGAGMILFHSYPNPIAYSVPFSDVYAFDTGLMVHLENAEKSARDNMELFLKKLVETVTRDAWNSLETEFIIKAGDASDDILSYAHQNKVILIAMGTQGKAGSEYDIIGSVTAEIIASSKVPVLAIPAETPGNISSEFRKVLYATNFDEKDFLALETLTGFLKPYDPEVHCVHIGKKGDPLWNVARLEGLKNLLGTKFRLNKLVCRLMIGDDILEELERYIENNNIDMLALTTHRRSMFSRIFNPSIARKMLFHTRIPLLVFHA